MDSELALSYVKALLRPAKAIKISEMQFFSAKPRVLSVNSNHLEAYRKVCGIRKRPTLPCLYPQAMSFPYLMSVLTDRRFPYRLLGSVHVKNKVTYYRPLPCEGELEFHCSITGASPHRKGVEVEISLRAFSKSELVWEVLMTFLIPQKTNETGASKGPPPAEDYSKWEVSPWKLAPNLGRRFGILTGDVNPIHLYPLTAKLFGFSRPIVHGLWVLARAIESSPGFSDSSKKFQVIAEFKRPIFLPANVDFLKRTESDTVSFKIMAKDKIGAHVVGQLSYV